MHKLTSVLFQLSLAVAVVFSFFLSFQQAQATRIAQSSIRFPGDGACTTDVRQCPDGGGYVSRNPALNCAFNPCPGEPGYNENGGTIIYPSPPIVCGNAMIQCPDGSFINPCFGASCPPLTSPPPTIQPSPSVIPTPSPNPGCTGPDINSDLRINLIDYSILSSNFLETKTAGQVLLGDIDCNAIVNLADYSILSQVFGTTIYAAPHYRQSFLQR